MLLTLHFSFSEIQCLKSIRMCPIIVVQLIGFISQVQVIVLCNSIQKQFVTCLLSYKLFSQPCLHPQPNRVIFRVLRASTYNRTSLIRNNLTWAEDTMFVSQGNSEKVPTLTAWYKTTETYSLTVLKTRHLKSRCQQEHTLSEGANRGSFLASFQILAVAGNTWCSSVHGQIASTLPVFT